MTASRLTAKGSPSIAGWIVGLIIALIGVVLGFGGAWLAVLGGSIYYFLTGVAMLLAGFWLVRGRMIGGWVYLGIVALTILWSFWEVGGDAWAHVPRDVAPLVLAVAVVLTMATLTARAARWRYAGIGVAAILIFMAGEFTILGTSGPDGLLAAMPAPSGQGMSDPSEGQVGADWPAYGGTNAARRYSPLAQINAANVGKLKRVWVAHTGDLPENMADNKYGAETTPLKIGDRLFLCSATNKMLALDAATGKTIWTYDPKVGQNWIPYTAACRGVAYYRNPAAQPGALCAERVIEGTLDGRLIAVDTRTGRPCPDFGQNGSVDIKKGMGEVVPGMVAISAVPTIVDGVVVTGHEVLDGQNAKAPSGVIQGFDAVTGKLDWAWDMTHPDWTGYPPEGQTWTRGSPNSWTTFSGDNALGLVYVPMGNAGVDYVSSYRTKPMTEFSSALVAIDVKTGKPRWKFQPVKKDVWDYDLGAQGTLVDWPVGSSGGGKVPAIILPSKQGDIFVLDRRTGKPLTPVAQYHAPQGGVEPAERAKLQPVSGWHTLRKAPLTERDMWGMSPIDQMVCRINFKRASYKGYLTPPTVDRHFIEYPGYNGGTDWGGIAVDPLRGVIIANYNDMPNYDKLLTREEVNERGLKPRGAGPSKGGAGEAGPQVNTPYGIDVNAGWQMPTGLLCKEPPYGGIRAIDMRTGKTIWDHPLGEARNNGPFGIPSHLPITIGTPNNGGTVVTAGGIAFVAATTDDLIRAVDMQTGKVLWEDTLPGGGQATPMTYQIDGRQYLVIMAGGHHFMKTKVSDALVAYALPG
ncbi:membrane-bound PQQ-dependent dehydrogenase, glucose/quinate/shikimate family [Stakelama pacifica]|uniref:Quinoprotein glucose dehydrogenase n=1 Tax=Stakelama pacifica TaxID=517720 RepID=A0A4R6FXC1_9SPHN|nr:membrane-bound PQQ-dependent dehydrogenase, glucose/quinate/shikimate family [Stakelama pacifica]TDN86551.1 quinoprotein glucose dehydrogenase [Stakelama pacifica]GGO89981.1 glucose dehydrogenase [Stakelama pacifica]